MSMLVAKETFHFHSDVSGRDETVVKGSVAHPTSPLAIHFPDLFEPAEPAEPAASAPSYMRAS